MTNTRRSRRARIHLWGVTSSHDILSRDEVPWNVMDVYSIVIYPILWNHRFEGIKAVLIPIDEMGDEIEPRGWSTLDEDIELMFEIYDTYGSEEGEV